MRYIKCDQIPSNRTASLEYRRIGFRNTVATKLESAGVPENIAADIVGHDKATMTYGLYSGGTSTQQKFDAVKSIEYNK